MRKYAVWLLSLVMVAVVLVGCNQQSGPESESASNTESQTESATGKTFTGNLKQIMGLGGAQKCTFAAEGNATGVVYTDGQRSRFEANNIPVDGFGDSTTTPGVGSIYSINDGKYTYTWSSNAQKGIKMRVEDQNVESDNANINNPPKDDGTTNKGENISNENYKYSCQKWRVDESLFVPPTDIEFQDFSAMMDNIKSKTGSLGSLCDMITDPAQKQECVKNMAESQQNLGQ